MFEIESKYGTYVVCADNISEARYTYASIISDKENINFNTVYESITNTTPTSVINSKKRLN